MTDAFDNEKNLLDALRSSDSLRRNRAYEWLVRTEAPRLKSLLKHRGVHPDDADDLLQEVFVKVQRSIREFDGDSSLRTWLRTIAVRAWIDWLRHKRARPQGFSMSDPVDADDEDAVIGTLKSSEPEPLEAAALAQLEECLQQAFAEFARKHPRHAAALRGEVNPDPASALSPRISKSGNERQLLSEARARLRVCSRHCRPSDES